MSKVEYIINEATKHGFYSTKSKCVFYAVLSNKELEDALIYYRIYYCGDVIREYVKKTAKRMHMRLSAYEMVKVCESLFYYLVLNY